MYIFTVLTGCLCRVGHISRWAWRAVIGYGVGLGFKLWSHHRLIGYRLMIEVFKAINNDSTNLKCDPSLFVPLFFHLFGFSSHLPRFIMLTLSLQLNAFPLLASRSGFLYFKVMREVWRGFLSFLFFFLSLFKGKEMM